MKEFDVDGHTYRAGRLDAFQQLHVARRLAPLLVGIGVVVGADGKPEVRNPFKNLIPAADVLAGMSDENVDFVTKTCAGAAMRKQGKSWASVMQNGVLMFDDMDVVTLLTITWEVVQANLEGFTRALQSLGLSKAQTEAPPS